LEEEKVLPFAARARVAVARITVPVWRILAHSLLFGLAGSIADLLFNFYLVSLGYAADTAGLLSTVYRVAGVVLGLPIGMAIDRIGARHALILGASGYGLSWILVIAAGDLWLLVGTYFVAGAANILTLTAVVPLLTSVTQQDERASLFGLNAAAGLMIGLVGSAIGGLLPMLAAGVLAVDPQATDAYRLALISVVVLGVCSVLPLLRATPAPVVEASAAAALEPVRRSRLSLVRLALPSLTLGIGGGLLLPFQNLFFRQVYGLSDAVVGVVLAVAAVGMGVGALLGGPASARLGLRRAAWALRLGAAPVMLLLLGTLPFALAGFFLRGLFVAASYPLNDALVMQATSARQRGVAVSLMSLFWSLGWAGSAWVSGNVQIHFGFGPVIVAGALAYVASAYFIATTPT
jgi:MFS family permease